MSGTFPVDLPEPPYCAVVFSSLRRDDREGVAYTEVAARMHALAAQQEGFLGVESVRDAEGAGITVSYWRDEAAIAVWRRHVEHAVTRETGRARWYASYALRVARVERAYGWERDAET